MDDRWGERRAWVEAYLEDRLHEAPDPPVAELQEAMAYALEGGKRVRALLTLEAAELGGLAPRDALPTAAAIECVHAYSLVHDDLPAMDDDRERRGRPTVHVQYGEANAILVGDSLLAWGFELISRDQPGYVPSGRVVEVLARLGRALGRQGITGGQYLDLQPRPPRGHPTEAHSGEGPEEPWREVHARKTAALIQAALAAGGILAEMAQAELEALEAFGEHMGLAYQAVDDLLDWDEPDSVAHLSRFRDRATAQTYAEAETEAARDALQPWGPSADRLRRVATELLHRTA